VQSEFVDSGGETGTSSRTRAFRSRGAQRVRGTIEGRPETPAFRALGGAMGAGVVCPGCKRRSGRGRLSRQASTKRLPSEFQGAVGAGGRNAGGRRLRPERTRWESEGRSGCGERRGRGGSVPQPPAVRVPACCGRGGGRSARAQPLCGDFVPSARARAAGGAAGVGNVEG
jgi:hypothetical protein